MRGIRGGHPLDRTYRWVLVVVAVMLLGGQFVVQSHLPEQAIGSPEARPRATTEPGGVPESGQSAQGRHDVAARWIGWGLTLLALAALVAWGRLAPRPTSPDQERVAQLSHAGRINAVGEMALSLAHELNQPLGAIANFAEGCLNTLDAPDPRLDEVRTALQRITAATMRASGIVDRVRAFVDGRPHPREAVSPNRVVADALDLLGTELRWAGVAVRMDLAPDLPDVWGDPTQLQQVLVNLIQNASQAFTRAQRPNPTVVVSTRRCDPDGIEFAVADNGPGIVEEPVSRVFDAFFSTRANGMGVGLAICRMIADAHQGQLTVESEPGIRTIFRLRIPTHRLDHE